MSIPSIRQIVENCPHGCGAPITNAKKANKKALKNGWIRYHRCNKCNKRYSVRYNFEQETKENFA